jgi:hypothetical protein
LTDQTILRKALTLYLCHIPLGKWPEFCVQSRAGRRKILSKRSSRTLWRLFARTNLWYLRYAFQFLTSPLRKEPTFFLMGFPKCGTTFLADLLNTLEDIDHPTSLSPLSKETIHYRKDQPIHHFMPIRGFYPMFSKASHFVDASVSYSLDPGAISLVKHDYPETKVILVVRDQVSAVESGINYYNFGLWRPDPSELDIFNEAEAYRQFPMQKAYEIVNYCNRHQCSIVQANKSQEIIELLGEDAPIAQRIAPLLYDMWLGFVYREFSQREVMVVNFSELITNPQLILQKAARFLHIEEIEGRQKLREKELNKHKSQKVFRLNEDTKIAIRDKFLSHNLTLKSMTGVDFNQTKD